MAGQARNVHAPVQVASKDTLYTRAIRLDRMVLPDVQLVVVDEVHQAVGKSHVALYDQYPNAIILGLTATPARPSGGTGLGDVFTSLVRGPSYSVLIEEGFIVPSRVIAPERPDLKGVKSTGGDYNQDQLQDRMDRPKLVGNVVETWKKYGFGRMTIVFATGIRHSMHLCEQFVRNGILAEHIDGEMDAEVRDDIFHRFRSGGFQVLTNCQIATFGLDIPEVSCAVFVCPTKSVVKYRQCCGRALRPFPGKTDAIIIDHAGAVFRHGLPDDDVPWTLDKETKIENEVERALKEKTPIVCDSCGRAYHGRKCPDCGADAPEKTPQTVEMSQGELVEIKRRRANAEATMEMKQGFWDKCFWIAYGKNLKVGAAAHMYRNRFGCWPNGKLLRVPRSDQWKMTAREFHETVLKNQ